MTEADTLTLPYYVENCPQCGNTHLGLMLTLRLQYCADCHTWLRYVKNSSKSPD
jgi:hypothetical protein